MQLFRESEAQTNPYTPEYFLKDGDDPEVLMLKDLTHNCGLSAGPKEIEMIEHARLKKDLETNMLPFTDEACFLIRKKMMETQELREFKLREAEMEAQRDVRLSSLARTLQERDESHEFLASQRVEAIRQSRMDVREKTMKKIRKKRIDILRKLARKRNITDSSIASTKTRDVINDYFDRSSDVYAPLKREGKVNPAESKCFDTTVRAAPLHIVDNVENLESTIPKVFTRTALQPPALGGGKSAQALMSKTAPLGGKGGGRAAESRLTSAAYRNIRNTKRDIETMHNILTRNRMARTGEYPQTQLQDDGSLSVALPPQSIGHTAQSIGGDHSVTASANNTADFSKSKTPSLLNKKPKGRPRTPDATIADRADNDNLPLYAAVTLLQRLIRGRATQNSMFEGRYRRSELIAELRASSDYEKTIRENPEESQFIAEAKWSANVDAIKETTMDSAAGAVSSNLLVLLATEKKRAEVFDELQAEAGRAVKERKERELMEGGRRQKDGVAGLEEVLALVSTTDPPEDTAAASTESDPASTVPNCDRSSRAEESLDPTTH